MANRKLNRASDQRKAILRNLTTSLIWNGKIVTTEARAKEVRSIAEKLITLASKEYKNSVEVTKSKTDAQGQTITIKTVNDAPSKLAARRRIMKLLYEVPAPREADETRKEYKARTRQVKHPVVEKLMRELGPKYKARAAEKGTGGGYTRIVKKGPRRGDGAEMVVLELV